MPSYKPDGHRKISKSKREVEEERELRRKAKEEKRQEKEDRKIEKEKRKAEKNEKRIQAKAQVGKQLTRKAEEVEEAKSSATTEGLTVLLAQLKRATVNIEEIVRSRSADEKHNTTFTEEELELREQEVADAMRAVLQEEEEEKMLAQKAVEKAILEREIDALLQDTTTRPAIVWDNDGVYREILNQIQSATNLSELKSAWFQARHEGFFEAHNREAGIQIHNALIHSAFRCGGKAEDCIEYYRKAMSNGCAHEMIYRAMLNISAKCKDISNLYIFYSVLKERNCVQPIDHFLVMRTLFASDLFRQALQVYYKIQNIPGHLPPENRAVDDVDNIHIYLLSQILEAKRNNKSVYNKYDDCLDTAKIAYRRLILEDYLDLDGLHALMIQIMLAFKQSFWVINDYCQQIISLTPDGTIPPKTQAVLQEMQFKPCRNSAESVHQSLMTQGYSNLFQQPPPGLSQPSGPMVNNGYRPTKSGRR